MLTGAEYILKQISLLGVKNIFGIPGAHIDPLLITAAGSEIETIINTHELSAGYMADGYSRGSKKIGILTGIGGPGSNNMITAVNTARVEKVPLLVITGDVPVDLSTAPGFQCGNEFGTNDDAIFKLITKYSKRITKIEELAYSMEQAIKTALSPPFGPTHLIIPYNIFNEKTDAKPKTINYDELKYWESLSSKDTISRIKKLILSDKKIIFWAGDSLNKNEQAEQIISLVEKFHIPIATSYSAKGVVSENHILSIGNFGYAGSFLSKELFLSDEPDVIIGFDIEQNERNSLNWDSRLYNDKKLLLINYPGSYSNRLYGESIDDNPLFVIKSLSEKLKETNYDCHFRKKWFKKFKEKFSFDLPVLPANKNGIVEPIRLVQIMQKELPKETILFVDAGNHRIFPGSYWKSPQSESFYSASIMAPLGWAIAAGIGCKFSRKEPVVIFTGDGCMQMHGIELKTAIKYNKPVLVIINNNKAFGSIYKRFLKISEPASRMASITEIDWNMFAKSFGAEVFDVCSEKQFTEHIRAFIVDQNLTILNVNTPVAPYFHDISLVKSAFA